MIKVAVVGARGRMGQAVSRAVDGAQDMELVAQLDSDDDISTDTLSGADVAVVFTVPAAGEDNVNALIDAGCPAVVGTTGWTDEKLERVRDRCEDSGVNVIIAPNYSLSAVLAGLFARQAAALFESVEVIELHHPDKLDAPSGTANSTATEIGRARREAGVGPSPDSTESDPLGTRGGVVEDVHVHAVRLRGLYAHEEILFGNPGEQLTIRQDSFDRSSFMPGVLLAVRKVSETHGLTYGIEGLLGLV